jgi:type IV pilus assembly protein PilE
MRGKIAMRRNMQGVTLMELMIVVVIIGILTAVAYPNYRDFVARAKRNEAKAALLRISTNQERFYLNNNTYTSDMTDLGFAVAGDFKTETGSYNIDVANGADSNTYSATASYLLGGKESAACLTFTIDATGAKTSLPYTDCWTRTR